MRPSVYLETSFISNLTCWPSKDLKKALMIADTREWWEIRKEYQLYFSEVVLGEIYQGDGYAAEARIKTVEEVQILPITNSATELAKALIESNAVPENALSDAYHIAIAAVEKIDYILTWNFRHIDNPEKNRDIIKVCEDNGFDCPIVSNPGKLLMLRENIE